MTVTRKSATALALIAALASPVAGAEKNDAADRCGKRAASAVQSRYEGVRDVAASFEQTTNAARLGGSPSAPSASRGRVTLAKPGKMRWNYEDPEPSLVVSDGKTVWIYDPAFGEAQKMPAAEGFLTGAAAQFLLGAGDMRRDFKVSTVSCTDAAAELELIPRQPATYEKVFLGIEPATGTVHRTRIVDLLGNVVTVEFRDQRFNLNPPESEFRFQAPDGVRVIEISQ